MIGAGHALMTEAPDAVLAALRSALAVNPTQADQSAESLK